VLIAQITDTHIRPTGKLLHHMVHTARSLRRCIEHIETLAPRPDVVIATGDLVDRGMTKEYRRLRKILSGLTIPLLLIPGNHDNRDALRDVFYDHAYLPRRGPLHYAVNTLPLRLIGLDSTGTQGPGGELDAAQLAWFAQTLAAEPRRPTFVFLHHPPFEIGVRPVDVQGFRHVRQFRAIVEQHSQIVGIASGHIHRSASALIGSARATTAPSTAHQVILARNAGGSYALRLEPPGFALHRWDGKTLQTSVHAITGAPGRAPRQLAGVSQAAYRLLPGVW
jgi:Icc protein